MLLILKEYFMPLGNLKHLFDSSGKTTLPPITGLDRVGYGITFKPHQADELKAGLFKITQGSRIFQSAETGKTYWVPEGYDVTDDFPLTTHQILNQVLIEASWEDFEKHFCKNAELAASHQLLPVDAIQVEQLKRLRSDEEAYYAVKTAFMPFWTLSIDDEMTLVSVQKALKLLPIPFQYKYRRKYEQFFQQYGTHYIKRAWVGGKAMLVLSIAKSTGMTQSEIRKALNSCSGLFGRYSRNEVDSLAKLRQHAECMLLVQGGDSTKMNILSSLDEGRYHEWLATIKDNPKVVEFEAAGIWTLFSAQQKATALLEAYKASTIFTPLSAMFRYEQKLYLIRGQECNCYSIQSGKTGETKRLTDLWPALSEITGFDQVEAVLTGTHIRSPDGESLSNKLFFFKGNQCIRLDIETKQIDEGYPKSIVEQWPGMSFDRIDAALTLDSESLYFFKGEEYIRYNLIENQVDPGYPKLIRDMWVGITFDKIDTAITWKENKAYFFRGHEVISYDSVQYCAEVGPPKLLVSNYCEEWGLFDTV
jgi:hypothetical protein